MVRCCSCAHATFGAVAASFRARRAGVLFELALLLLEVLEHSLSGAGMMKDSWASTGDSDEFVWTKSTEWKMGLRTASANAVIAHVERESCGGEESEGDSSSSSSSSSREAASAKRLQELCTLLRSLEEEVKPSCMHEEWTTRPRASGGMGTAYGHRTCAARPLVRVRRFEPCGRVAHCSLIHLFGGEPIGTSVNAS